MLLPKQRNSSFFSEVLGLAFHPCQCWKSMIVHVCSQDWSTSLNARYAFARHCSASYLTCYVSVQVKIRMVLGPQHSICADRTSRYLLGSLMMGTPVSPVMTPLMVCSSHTHLCHSGLCYVRPLYHLADKSILQFVLAKFTPHLPSMFTA